MNPLLLNITVIFSYTSTKISFFCFFFELGTTGRVVELGGAVDFLKSPGEELALVCYYTKFASLTIYGRMESVVMLCG